MPRVVIDASALAAIAFGEPAGPGLATALHGADVHAPELLKFELANVAWKLLRRRPRDATAIVLALEAALGTGYGIHWQDVETSDVLLVARAVGCTAYDAAYLWLAGTLGADLVTLDVDLARLSERVVA